jgi:uncharacterized protein (TIGR02271 family)
MTDERATGARGASRDEVLPVVEEEVIVRRERRRTGIVAVETGATEAVQHVAVPLIREVVDIQRVPVGREIEAAPGLEEREDRVIIPVVEEEVIVRKRLVLREEIHLIKRRSEEIHEADVPLRKDEVRIERRAAEEAEAGLGTDEQQMGGGSGA